MPFDPIAHYYDADDGRLREDIPTILGFAQKTGGPVLELGVGTGRLALPVAAAGYQVTGIDSSPHMLALARQHIAEAHLEEKITLLEADFRNFTLNTRFGLAYCGFNSFLHLIEVRDQVTALRCWRRHLRAEGLLVIDVHNPQLAQLAAADGALSYADTWIDEKSGHLVQKFYASETCLSDQVTIVRRFYDEHTAQGLQRTSITFSTRILFRRELELLLRHAGYEDIRFYGDHELSLWEPESPRIIAVARPA
jgi:ubiquinone/menaquinone biosynthesis C-methylase UbiE